MAVVPFSWGEFDLSSNAAKHSSSVLKSSSHFSLFPILPIASLTCKSFFRVSDSTHSQAVHSATYMQFKAVITSVILSPKGTHSYRFCLNEECLFCPTLFFWGSFLHIPLSHDCFYYGMLLLPSMPLLFPLEITYIYCPFPTLFPAV